MEDHSQVHSQVDRFLAVLKEGYAEIGGIDLGMIVGAMQNSTEISKEFCHRSAASFYEVEETSLDFTKILLVRPKPILKMNYSQLQDYALSVGGFVRDDYVDILIQVLDTNIADFTTIKDDGRPCVRIVGLRGKSEKLIPLDYDVRPGVWAAVYAPLK